MCVSVGLHCLQALMCGQISGLPCLWWESEAFVCSSLPSAPLAWCPLSHWLTQRFFFIFYLPLCPSPVPLCVIWICAVAAYPCMWQQGGSACEDSLHCLLSYWRGFLREPQLKSPRALFNPPSFPCSLVSLEVLWIIRGGGCPALWLNPHSLSLLPPQREDRRRQGKREGENKETGVFCSWHSTKTCTADEKHMIWSNTLLGDGYLTKRFLRKVERRGGKGWSPSAGPEWTLVAKSCSDIMNLKLVFYIAA